MCIKTLIQSAISSLSFMAMKMNLTVREKEIKWQKTNILKGKEDEMVPKYKLELYLKARCRGL